MDNFITKEKVFVQTSKLAEVLINSDGYEAFHDNIVKNNIVYEESKNYEIVGAGFIDFNQHLYEDINHMNSISSGLYLDMTLIMLKIYIYFYKLFIPPKINLAIFFIFSLFSSVILCSPPFCQLYLFVSFYFFF